jgi:hypothetical protein
MVTPEHNAVTHPRPESARRLIQWTVVVGYGLALAAFLVAFAGSGFRFTTSAVDALPILVLVAVPPTLAVLSLRRPLLLLPAALTGFLGLFSVLSIWGWGLALLSVFWVVAYLQSVSNGLWLRKMGMVLVFLLFWVGTAILWAHLDPACEQRLGDGTVREIDPATRGFTSGWVWEVDTSSFHSSGTSSGDVVYEICSSDTRVLWESTAIALLATGAVLVGWALADPKGQAASVDVSQLR